MTDRPQKWVLSVYILICSSYLSAINPKIPINQNLHTIWSSKNGLPSDNITSVMQDSKGYIWIGSYNGLVKFDGVHFTVISYFSDKGFQSNSANIILEDEQDILWIGTNGDGLARYDHHSFTMIDMNQGLPGNIIHALTCDNRGFLFIGTNNGVAFIDNESKLHLLKDPALKNTSIVMLAILDHTLWVSTNAGTLYAYDVKTLEKKPHQIPLHRVTCMLKDHDRIWVGTMDSGLFHIDDHVAQACHVIKKNKAKMINALYKDTHGVLWISSDSGLFRFIDGTYSCLSTQNGLNDDQVNNVHEDREGNLWITTARGGLSKLSEGKFKTLSTKRGLINNTVNCIMASQDESIWIGTDEGLSIYRNGSFNTDELTEELKGVRIRHIIQDKKGGIWICTYSPKGAIHVSHNGIKSYSIVNGLTANRCRVAYEDHLGQIWIGTASGLNKLSTGQVQTFTRKDGLDDDYILCIFQDSEKCIWIGTNGGGSYRIEADTITRVSLEDGLPSNIIFRILEDSKKNLWFSTSKGISLKHQNGFYNYTVKEGMFGNAVFQIIEDSMGTFWMTADIGIFTARLDDMLTIHNQKPGLINMTLYNSLDGLPGAVTPVSWGQYLSNGTIWFPTHEGIAIINSHSLPKNSNKPPIYIESIDVDNIKLDMSSTINLSPGAKRITFRYTALSYIAPEKVLFRTKLKGFEAEWSDLTDQREATYTSLPPGDYVFQVKGMNNDGLWSETFAELALKQRPRFAQTLWFPFTITMTVILLSTLFYRNRSRILRRRKAELQFLVYERTKEIEEKSLILEKRTKELEVSKIEIQKVNLTLEKLSKTDSLTELANRRYFDTYMTLEWERGIRNQKEMTVLMLDVDFFKLYNDEYGHQKGDNCLVSIASVIKESVLRKTDLSARYGGEEFVITLPETGTKDALVIAERIRELIHILNIPHCRSDISDRITISTGIATVTPIKKYTYEHIVKKADYALYQSKSKGRNWVTVFRELGASK